MGYVITFAGTPVAWTSKCKHNLLLFLLRQNL